MLFCNTKSAFNECNTKTEFNFNVSSGGLRKVSKLVRRASSQIRNWTKGSRKSMDLDAVKNESKQSVISMMKEEETGIKDDFEYTDDAVSIIICCC